MATKKNIIPKHIAKKLPAKCPVCNSKCVAIFRTWKAATGRVSCEFIHYKIGKSCKKTYDY